MGQDKKIWNPTVHQVAYCWRKNTTGENSPVIIFNTNLSLAKEFWNIPYVNLELFLNRKYSLSFSPTQVFRGIRSLLFNITGVLVYSIMEGFAPSGHGQSKLVGQMLPFGRGFLTCSLEGTQSEWGRLSYKPDGEHRVINTWEGARRTVCKFFFWNLVYIENSRSSNIACTPRRRTLLEQALSKAIILRSYFQPHIFLFQRN